MLVRNLCKSAALACLAVFFGGVPKAESATGSTSQLRSMSRELAVLERAIELSEAKIGSGG